MQTAGDGVLEGTVRRLVIEICKRENIKMSLSTPSLREIGKW